MHPFGLPVAAEAKAMRATPSAGVFAAGYGSTAGCWNSTIGGLSRLEIHTLIQGCGKIVQHAEESIRLDLDSSDVAVP
jgi:hypothetical protein